MINSQELVSKIKSQHLILQEDLAFLLEDSKLKVNGEKIISQLIKFKNDLLNHLELENKQFYADYLDKKMKRNEDIESTEEFIKQMNDISKIVINFLNKYNSPEIIEQAFSDFRKELLEVSGVLNARIETEEEGIFDLYLML
jgi:regulator of sigma D